MFTVVQFGPNGPLVVEDDSVDFAKLGITGLSAEQERKVRSEYQKLYSEAKSAPRVIPLFVFFGDAVKRRSANVEVSDGMITLRWPYPPPDIFQR